MKKIHTFAICAYKQSPYLEECIKSLLPQRETSEIIICTSTPNEYIKVLAQKYNIPIYINEIQNGIGADWNFAYSKTNTKLVTIAHQDDIYCKEYAKKIIEYFEKEKTVILLYTKYAEIRNGKKITDNKNLRIKSFMNYAIKLRLLQQIKFIRKTILAFGNPICCPSVTFNKQIVTDNPFDEKMKTSLDWDAWLRLSQLKGKYIYIDKILMGHRISELSETTHTIANGTRMSEDYQMFKKIWPDFIAKILVKLYSESMKNNEL